MLLLSFGEGEFVCAPRDLYRGCTVRYIIISCISRCPVAVTNTWPKQFKRSLGDVSVVKMSALPA